MLLFAVNLSNKGRNFRCARLASFIFMACVASGCIGDSIVVFDGKIGRYGINQLTICHALVFVEGRDSPVYGEFFFNDEFKIGFASSPRTRKYGLSLQCTGPQGTYTRIISSINAEQDGSPTKIGLIELNAHSSVDYTEIWRSRIHDPMDLGNVEVK